MSKIPDKNEKGQGGGKLNRRDFLKLSIPAMGMVAMGGTSLSSVVAAAPSAAAPNAVGMLYDSRKCVGCRRCEDACRRMGKETVKISESPGFVTTRINALIGNEAFQMLQEGLATPADIDKAVKLGLNHPMGPFEMVDLVGLDTRLKILEYLYQTLGEKYRPAPLLVRYVKAGRLGRKVGKGVYDYRGNDETARSRNLQNS